MNTLNLNCFFKYLESESVYLCLINSRIALTEKSKEPNKKILAEIKQNKESIKGYLALETDRSKPCLSSTSGCVYSLPTIGCINSKYRSLTDKYREDCSTCEGFININLQSQTN